MIERETGMSISRIDRREQREEEKELTILEEIVPDSVWRWCQKENMI